MFGCPPLLSGCCPPPTAAVTVAAAGWVGLRCANVSNSWMAQPRMTLMMRGGTVAATDRPVDVFYLAHNRSRTGVQSICIHYSSQAIITTHCLFITLVTDSFARGRVHRGRAAPSYITDRRRRIKPTRHHPVPVHQSPRFNYTRHSSSLVSSIVRRCGLSDRDRNWTR